MSDTKTSFGEQCYACKLSSEYDEPCDDHKTQEPTMQRNQLGEQLEEACTCAHSGKCEACLEAATSFAESAHGE